MRRDRRLIPALALPLLVAAVAAPIAIGAVVNVSMQDNFFQPKVATTAMGDTVTWTNNGINPHNSKSTDVTVKNPNGTPGLGLWDGPIVGNGGTFSRAFRFAGRFPYYCEVHGAAIMSGTVSTRLRATKAAVSGGTRITVTWATVAPPSGLVFDVQRRLPGSTTFQNWKVGVTTTSGSFVTSTPGTYTFRSRVRRPSTGGISLFSEAKSVTI